MAGFEKDDVSKLSDTNDMQLSGEHDHSRFNGFASRTRNASISILMESCESGTDDLVGHTIRSSGTSSPCKNKFLQVMNPLTKVVQQWNKIFVISCLVAIFVDPLFFFLLSVQQDNKCIVINMPMTTTIVTLRSVTDLIYFLHMLLQFRLAYVDPESTVFGAGELIKNSKEIAVNYLRGYFAMDLFMALPLPQIIILLVLLTPLGFGKANTAKNLLRIAVLVQYIPRIYKFLSLLAGQSPTGFVFETAWANFVINLLTFVSSGHVVGSCWYLFGLQRVNQCLQDACHESSIKSCKEFIDCGHGDVSRKFQSYEGWGSWKNNSKANACFSEDGFSYGIYKLAVNLTTKHSIITKYTYSLFWGFQQISTLAGNLVPSDFVGEVLFTMAIIGLGLLLFALLIGNMQNFLQALGKRRLEMSLRRRDVEQWMSHRRIPKDLRRKVVRAERYNFSATRGVNEEELLENLPEDVQRDIRRHLYKFIKKVNIFDKIDHPVLDAIYERLRQTIYIKDSVIFYRGGLVEKMVFIVRGTTESIIGEDGNAVLLSEGDVCGEELLPWCLEHFTINKDGKNIRIPGLKLLSKKTVKCTTNVEAFSLRAADLEEVTSLFSSFLIRSPSLLQAIRCESPSHAAATRIQVAWRDKRKRLNRSDSSQLNPISPTFAHSVSTSAPSFVLRAGFSEETNIMFQTMLSKMDTLQASVDKLQTQVTHMQTTVDRIDGDRTFLHTQVMQTRERQDAMMRQPTKV